LNKLTTSSYVNPNVIGETCAEWTATLQAKKVTKHMSLKGSGHISEDEESQLVTPSKQVPSGASDQSESEGSWSASGAKPAVNVIDRR